MPPLDSNEFIFHLQSEVINVDLAVGALHAVEAEPEQAMSDGALLEADAGEAAARDKALVSSDSDCESDLDRYGRRCKALADSNVF